MTESSGDDLAAALEECSKRGARIGIAAGAFGLIHAGTARFLRVARERCDCLFAAVLSEPAGASEMDGSGADSTSVSPGGAARLEMAAQLLLRPDERRRVLAAMEEVEGAGPAGADGLPLSEWARLAPSARWMVSGAEGDAGGACEAQLRRAGISAETIHEEDACTTRALLLRMGASGRS